MPKSTGHIYIRFAPIPFPGFAIIQEFRNSPRYNTGKTGIKLKASG